MNLDDDVIIIPVFFWDHWRPFVVDTGSAITFLDSTFTNHLSYVSTSEYNGVHGTTGEAQYYKGVPINVGNRWGYPETVGASDMTQIERMCGASIDGLLGTDVLGQYILTFDFEAKTLSLETNLPPPIQLELPFKPNDDGVYMLPAKLADAKEIELGIDTGFAGEIMLNPADWKKAFPDGPEKTKMLKSANFQGKIAESVQTRLPALRIGSQIYTNLLCNRQANTNIPSQLGLDFLRDHRVIIDYPNERIQLHRVRLDWQDSSSMTGLGVKWVRGSAIISEIYPGSAGENAGLKPGDEILRINGKRVWELKRSEAYAITHNHEGDKVELSIMRGSQTMKIQIVLKSQI